MPPQSGGEPRLYAGVVSCQAAPGPSWRLPLLSWSPSGSCPGLAHPTHSGAPGERTCRACLKPLQEAELLTQDPPDQAGHQEHGPGPAGPAGVHPRVGRQGDAALGPEAPGGGVCGGEEL